MYRITVLYEFKERSLYEMYSDGYMLISPVLTEKVGRAGSFKFDLPFVHPEYAAVVPFRTYITIYKDEEEYWHGRVIDAEEDFYRTKSVICEGDLAFLNDSRIPVYEYAGDIPAYIDYILNAHNTQVDVEKRIYRGIVEVTDSNGYIARANQNYPNALAELTSKLINTYGGYFRTRRVDGKIYLDYLYQYGEPNTQQLRIEENILDYSCKFGGDFCTRLIPLGAKPENSGEENPQRLTIASVNGGMIYVDNAELVARYGVIVGTKNWDDVTDPVNLKLKGQSYVNSQEFPRSLELTAVDLSNINVDIEMLRIGCMTEVISPFHELFTSYFLSGKVSHLDSPEDDYVSLGSEISTYTGKTAKRQQHTENQLSKVEQEALESIINIGKAITGVKGGYVVLDTYDSDGRLVNPWQILIMDQPDKTKAKNVIRMNQGGIAFSTSGYNGQYKTAWDINGNFVADFIKAGTMLADRIRGGTLELGGINNQNGVLRISNAAGGQIGIWDKDGIQLNAGTSVVKLSPTGRKGAIELGGDARIDGSTVKAINYIDFDGMRLYDNIDSPATTYNSSLEPIGLNVYGETRNDVANYSTDCNAMNGSFDGDLSAYGEKNRIVRTAQYGDIKMAAYETASPMFGDIGSGVIGADGICYVVLTPEFLETVNVSCEYQVFLQAYTTGELIALERTPTFFVVQGTPGQRFSWEIKAHQLGYEQNRLDCKQEHLKAQELSDYAGDGLEHYKKYMEELVL